MNSTTAIVHEAVVLRAEPASGTLKVMVADSDAGDCSSCAAAAVCQRGKGGELTVRSDNPERYNPGMKVRIAADSNLHYRAVALMLALPCLMLVLPIVALCIHEQPDWIACLSGIVLCALTFVALRLCRRKLSAGMTFRIIES